MEDKLNEKLESYRLKNTGFTSYLKFIKAYYNTRKRLSNEDMHYLYECIIRDINYVMNKQISEELEVNKIVEALSRLSYKSKDELVEFYNEFMEILDILNKSIDTSHQYIKDSITKYKLLQKNIKFDSNIDYETIKSEIVANRFNQKALLKELKKSNFLSKK